MGPRFSRDAPIKKGASKRQSGYGLKDLLRFGGPGTKNLTEVTHVDRDGLTSRHSTRYRSRSN